MFSSKSVTKLEALTVHKMMAATLFVNKIMYSSVCKTFVTPSVRQ
jgi:hypothetical protein